MYDINVCIHERAVGYCPQSNVFDLFVHRVVATRGRMLCCRQCTWISHVGTYLIYVCIILHCGLPSRLSTTTMAHHHIILYYSRSYTLHTHTVVDNNLDLYNINIIVYSIHIKSKLSQRLL